MQHGEAIGKHPAGRKTLEEHLFVYDSFLRREHYPGSIDHGDQLEIEPAEIRPLGGKYVPVEGVGVDVPVLSGPDECRHKQRHAEVDGDAFPL